MGGMLCHGHGALQCARGRRHLPSQAGWGARLHVATVRAIQCVGRALGPLCGGVTGTWSAVAPCHEGRCSHLWEDPVFCNGARPGWWALVAAAKNFLPRRPRRVLPVRCGPKTQPNAVQGMLASRAQTRDRRPSRAEGWGIRRARGSQPTGNRGGFRPDPKVGKADKTPKPKDPPKLLGNSLTGKEGARSLDHRPKDKKTGKYVCWDHITHRGCSAPNCPHAHLKQPPKWDTLDWSVQLQLLRRGGLRDRGQLNAKDVVAQMDTIRANVKSKNEENVREGKRAKSGGPVNPPEEAEEGAPQEDRDKVGESPPEELLEFHPTDLENRLVEWLEGGDPSFAEDADESRHVRDFPAEGLPAVAEERIKAMAEIDKTELANGIGGVLGVYLRNRLLQAKEADPQMVLGTHHVREYLEEARRDGTPEVAAEADSILGNRVWPKVGYKADLAHLTRFQWQEGIGRAQLLYEGTSWDVLDFGDKLPVPADLVPLMSDDSSQAPDVEIRQCLLLHCTAGCLAAKYGARDLTLNLVQNATQAVRVETARQAVAAEEHLGEMAEDMWRAEADVRVFAHDFLHYHHDKDYRCLVAFPPDAYELVQFHIVRMDPQGDLTVERITGLSYDTKKGIDVWVLVHQGHMRLPLKPADVSSPPVVRDVLAAGWEVHLEAAMWPEARVRARDLLRCPRCDTCPEGDRRTGTHEVRPAPVLGLYPLDVEPSRAGGPVMPIETRELPSSTTFTTEEICEWLGPQAGEFHKACQRGLDLLEVYAGTARATQAVRNKGGVAICIGLEHGQDLTRARDRALCRYLLQLLKPEHLWLSFPCTAFCAWMKLAAIRDSDIQPRLKEGRFHLGYAFELASTQRASGRHAHAENPLTSTAWQEPVAVEELSHPEWLCARLDQCTTGLSGPQGGLHLKPTLIRTTDPEMQRILDRQCSGDHPHELVQGAATALSAMYSPYMANLIASVVVRKPKVGGGSCFAPKDCSEQDFPLSSGGRERGSGGRGAFRARKPTRPLVSPSEGWATKLSQARPTERTPRPEGRRGCSELLEVCDGKPLQQGSVWCRSSQGIRAVDAGRRLERGQQGPAENQCPTKRGPFRTTPWGVFWRFDWRRPPGEGEGQRPVGHQS